ncbi:MAG: copper chaperone CopZ [Spirochaetales bacterium]|jgi:copper chaperone|nr:copper chaperone CopZ [Spirochaetales bacterium]
MSKLVLAVEGMSCNHCKMAVETALKSLAGVDTATVDLKNKTASVSYDESKCGLPAMKEAIETQGYTVGV